MTRSRSVSSLPRPAVARAAGLGLLAASLLAGCVVVDGRGGPPPHAPAYGARARSVVVLPPPVTVTPSLVVIAGTPVSYAANWPDDLFFYEGRYYRPYQGNWYWTGRGNMGTTGTTTSGGGAAGDVVGVRRGPAACRRVASFSSRSASR